MTDKHLVGHHGRPPRFMTAAVDLTGQNRIGRAINAAMGNIEEGKLRFLLDRAEISDVQLRYAIGVDLRDWRLYRSCFTDEIDTDFTSVFGGEPRRMMADEWVAFARRTIDGLQATQHMITNHVITIDGD